MKVGAALGATEIVTPPVWFVLFLGALINVFFVLAFVDRRSERLIAQMCLVAAVTAITVAGLLLVWFLDHPYENSTGSIKPDQMQRTLTILTTARESHAPLPCNAEGVPLRL